MELSLQVERLSTQVANLHKVIANRDRDEALLVWREFVDAEHRLFGATDQISRRRQ